MIANLQDREHDCSGLASMTGVEASDAIKAFIEEQNIIREFGVAWPNHRKLERELKEIGFAEITVSKIEPHCVYVFVGRTGRADCRSLQDLQRTIGNLARQIGFKFCAADVALHYSRGRFRAALCLPDESDQTEVAPHFDEAGI